MKLLESTKSKINKDKKGEDVPHLKVVELVLVHCSLVIMTISKIRGYCIPLHQTRHLVAY